MIAAAEQRSAHKINNAIANVHTLLLLFVLRQFGFELCILLLECSHLGLECLFVGSSAEDFLEEPNSSRVKDRSKGWSLALLERVRGLLWLLI